MALHIALRNLWQDTSHPAYNVSWDDINKLDGFLDKLNQSLGCDISALPTDTTTRYHPDNVPSGCYRLPTESEWEYAARGGTTTRFSYGDDSTYTQLSSYGWYESNSSSMGTSHPSYGTHSVGQKLANPLGLYDMHGNVYEWTYDRYGTFSSSHQIDPSGDQSGSHRVVRGGGWDDLPRILRSAYRNNRTTDFRSSISGFRLVLVTGQQGGNQDGHNGGMTSLSVPSNLATTSSSGT